MRRGKCILVAVVLCGIVGVLVEATAGAQAPVTFERHIVIAPDASGTCAVQQPPDAIKGAGAGDQIIWHIQNNCDATKTVDVGHFMHRPDNQEKNPVDLGKSQPTKPGAQFDLTGRVRPLPPKERGTYKYDVLIDGVVALDPELEIVR